MMIGIEMGSEGESFFMFLEKNMRALRDVDPACAGLLNRLENAVAATDVMARETAAGDYALYYRGCWLHDPEGAAGEAERIAASHCRPLPGRAHLILGLGLGYLADAAMRRSPGRVVVYEPDLALLRFALENADLSDCLATGRIRLASDLPDLLAALAPFITSEDPVDILVTQGYAALMANAVPPLMDALARLTEERLLECRTARYFHTQWIRRFFENLPAFSQAAVWADRKNNGESTGTGGPALIIGRGPSLDAAIEDIRVLCESLCGSMTLIAAGGALRRLHEAGITPDYAVFYDANGMREQLFGLPEDWLARIHFLVNPFTESCCFTGPARSRTLFFPQSGAPFADWLRQALPEEAGQHPRPLLLEGGGTVSLIALQAALAMACDPIVLIGQDLSFPNERAYAGDITLKRDVQGRMALVESGTLYAKPEAMGTVTGQNGEPLPALKAYEGFIRHFEAIARKNATSSRPVRFINASIGGARIEGYELLPLSALAFNKRSDGQTPPEPNRLHLPTENLSQALAMLRRAVAEAIRLHDAVLYPAENHQADTPPNQALYDFLNAHPLISHFLLMEMMDVQRRYQPNPSTDEETEANRACLRTGDRNCRDLLKDMILPWICEAEAEFAALSRDSVRGYKTVYTQWMGQLNG